MDLRNAAIAFFRMAVASESYTQHVVANGMISLLRVFDYLCYLALPNETPKSSRKRSSITDEENTPRTPDTPSTSLKKFSFEDTQMKITKKNLRPGFDPVAVPNVPSSQPY
jgi:hypothetical protein